MSTGWLLAGRFWFVDFETSDGVRLAVRESGPADAPVTVVLAHGWTNDMSVWEPVVAALGPDVHVLRYDHRGHGDSDPAPRGTATIEQVGDDLAELLAERVRGQVVLVGHSMGGMAMMSLAARHPDLVVARVRAAVFVATSSGRLREVTFGLPAPLVRLANRLGRKRKPKAKARIPTPPRTAPHGALPLRSRLLATGAVRWLAFGDRPDWTAVKLTLEQVARTDRHSAGGFRRALGSHELRDALAGFADVRTVVLAGELDRLTPLEHARTIAAALPGAELVIYPGSGHMLPYERTAEVAARIRSAALNQRARSRVR